MKKYYKVVYNEQGNLTSACVSGKYRTNYKVGEYIESNILGTRMFLFTELAEAIRFKHLCCESFGEIYEAKAIGTIKVPAMLFHSGFDMYWNAVNTLLKKKRRIDIRKLKHYGLDHTYTSVVAAKKVKLLKKVENV